LQRNSKKKTSFIEAENMEEITKKKKLLLRVILWTCSDQTYLQLEKRKKIDAEELLETLVRSVLK